MKSTPTQAHLRESAEPPPFLRMIFRREKILLDIMVLNKRLYLLEEISQLSSYHTFNMWQNTDPPYLMEAYFSLYEKKREVIYHGRIPCYSHEFYDHHSFLYSQNSVQTII